MPIDLNVGVDWNRDGHICLETTTTDKLSSLGLYIPKVLDYSAFEYQGISASETITIEDSTTFPDLYHGLNQFKVVTSSGTTDGMRVFNNGSRYSIPLNVPNGQTIDYYFVFWFKATGFAPTEQLLWRIYSASGATLENSGTVDFDTDWVRVSASCSIGGPDTSNLHLYLAKNSTATTLTMYFTGFMMFFDTIGMGYTTPSFFNTGAATDPYDNITSDIDNTIYWSGGVESYQPTESEHRSFFTLSNTFPARKYSLENPNSPLYGIYPNDLLFRIVDIGASNDNPLYKGNIDIWTPSLSMKGEQIVSVETTNSFSRKKDIPILPDLYEATTTGVVISDLLQKADANADVSQIATGLRTINYYGDNADDKNPVPQQAQGLASYLEHMVGAELGKLYSDGLGRQVFVDEDWLINNTSSATYTDEFTAYEYHVYGSMLLNQVIVKCYPRVEDSSSILWGMDKDLRIPAGQKRTIKGKYTDANNSEVGGKTVVTPSGADYVVSGATPTVTITKGGQYFEVEFDNSTGTQDSIVSTYNVRGLPVSTFNDMQAIAQDDNSIAQYGLATVTIDLKAIDDPDVAFYIAQRILARFITPRSEFSYIQLSKEYNSADSVSLMATTFGTRITVVESQTLHNADYLIVGWAHEIIISEYRHNIGLMLESAVDTIDMVYDDDFSSGLGANLTLSDAGSRFTISSGTAVLATGALNAYLYYNNVTIANGTAFLVRFNYSAASGIYMGMDTNHTDTTGHKSLNQVVTDSGSASLPRTWSSDTMNFIVVQVYGGYQLHFFDNQLQYIRSDGNTTPQDLFFASQTPGTDAGTIYHMRVANLIGKWQSTDYSWADYYLANPAASFTHTPSSADQSILIQWTPASNGTLNIRARRENDTDCIRILCDQAGGAVTAYANGTSLATQAVTFTASTTYDIQVSLQGSNIAVYVDDSRKISTTSTHNLTVKEIKVTRATGDATAEYIVANYYQSADIGLRLLQANLTG